MSQFEGQVVVLDQRIERSAAPIAPWKPRWAVLARGRCTRMSQNVAFSPRRQKQNVPSWDIAATRGRPDPTSQNFPKLPTLCKSRLRVFAATCCSSSGYGNDRAFEPSTVGHATEAIEVEPIHRAFPALTHRRPSASCRGMVDSYGPNQEIDEDVDQDLRKNQQADLRHRLRRDAGSATRRH